MSVLSVSGLMFINKAPYAEYFYVAALTELHSKSHVFFKPVLIWNACTHRLNLGLKSNLNNEKNEWLTAEGRVESKTCRRV